MTIISRSEFEKKVDIEYAHLVYMEHMSEDKARYKARQTVSQSYQVE